MSSNKRKIVNAAKWSTITEIAAKLVMPVSNMILARLLTPEAFGVVATATMVFSFADMFTDAGFQKYLVQHEFCNEEEYEQSITVAFWTNMVLSLLFWLVIAAFSNPIAAMVGNEGLGNVIAIACVSLPLTSFSSIQMALYRREFKYKSLFYVRMIGVLIPLFVTVPLACLTHSYWAIIVGTICGNITNAVVLTTRSKWKPRLFYRFSVLKKMLSFSIWSLIESLTVWLGDYIGVFIVGACLSTYYMGLYKTSMNTVNQIMTLITSATASILFAALSREQGKREVFEATFFSFQRNVGLFILPMGVGMLCYRGFVTQILLGSQWTEAAGFVGLWGFVNSIKIVLSNYCSEAYRALGRPKLSVFAQTTQIIVLVPVLLYGASKGFETLYIMRCLVSLELILVNLILANCILKIAARKMIVNIVPELISAGGMAIIALLLQQISMNMLWQAVSIVLCAISYFAVLLMIPQSRQDFLPIIKKYLGKVMKKTKFRRTVRGGE